MQWIELIECGTLAYLRLEWWGWRIHPCGDVRVPMCLESKSIE
jgi:hypothetical protein